MVLDELRDEELARMVQRGDPSGWRILVQRYEARTLARIRARLHPRLRAKVDPEDVLQDAYCVVAKRIHGFEGRREGSFALWFAHIVRNKVREALRRHLDAARRDVRCEVEHAGRSRTARSVGREPSPCDAAIGSELADRVRVALTRLPCDYVQILWLSHVEGATLRDAARVMRRSHDAVKKLYRRAVRRLCELSLAEHSGIPAA